MTDSAELPSLLVTIEFAVMAAVVALLVLFDATIPFLPLALTFLAVLYLYQS